VFTSVLILSVALLGFALYVGVISSLHHARAQHTAYADFRKALAEGTAPVSQLEPTDDPSKPGKLLPLGTSVAVLSIPKIHLKEVVFEGTTPSVMQNGPGHLRSTPLPGQAGISEIMGRAATYGGPFGRLSDLHAGDTITVTTGQGESRFRVLDVRRAGDPLPAPLQPDKGRLLLATASGAPFVPSGVLRVDADLISPTLATPALVLSAKDISPTEHAMGTDPSAWLPLVLFGQALVLAAILLSWARTRWGRWQTWIVAVPVLLFFGLAVADQAARLLPNLM
jgi:LPXTG-site transpeptidase (sortase) family protein